MMYKSLVCTLLFSLCGCSMMEDAKRMLAGDEDNAIPPAELVEFMPSLNVAELWSRRIGKGTDKIYLRLSPVYAAQRLYIVDSRGRLQALDATNGREFWSRNAIQKQRFWSKGDKAKISAGPGYGEESLLVGTNDGEVFAYRSQDGKFLWRARVSSEILSAPKRAGGTVIVRTLDGKLHALSGENGRRLWVYDREVPSLSLRGTSSPVIKDDMVIAGFDEGRLVALELKTGRLLWEARISTPRGSTDMEQMVDIDSDPIILEGVIYAATYQGQVAAVQQETGRILWTSNLSSYAGFTVDEDFLYVSDHSSHIRAFDRYSGEQIWEQGRLNMRNVTAPARVGDYLVVGDVEGYLHWLDKRTGNFVARTQPADAPYIAPPLVVGNILYAFSSDGTLTASTFR